MSSHRGVLDDVAGPVLATLAASDPRWQLEYDPSVIPPLPGLDSRAIDLLDLWAHDADPGYAVFEGVELGDAPTQRAWRQQCWDLVRPFDTRRFLARGALPLCVLPVPERYLATRRPIDDVPALAGARLAAFAIDDVLLTNTFPDARARHVVQERVGEQLASGALDGAWITLPRYLELGWHAAAPYLVGPIFGASRRVVLIAKEWFDQLPAAEQSRWRAAFGALEDQQRAAFVNALFDNDDTLASVRQAGSTIEPMAPTLAQHVQRTQRDVILPGWARRVWGDYEALDAYNAAFREVLGFTIARDGTVMPT